MIDREQIPTREVVKEWLERTWKVYDPELGEGIDMLYGIYMAEVCWAYVDGRLVEVTE